MKFNGYLRFLEINMDIVKNLMTETSLTMYEDFMEKHSKDSWICPTCTSPCNPNHQRWKCLRCLFWFHNKCANPKTLKRNFAQAASQFSDTEKASENYVLCFSCFFSLPN
jgi:hypothetical protein